MARYYKYINIEKSDGIATLRFADPNDDEFIALSHPMHRELRDVFSFLQADEEIGAVLIAGGDDQFCPAPELANLDVLLNEDPAVAERLQTEANEIVTALIEFSKPTVAMVTSPCVGFGPQLAFLSDALVATRDAYFRDLHVRVGLTAGDGGTLTWPLLFGFGRARRHVLRSVPLSAEEAFELGVVDDVADSEEEAFQAAMALADKMRDLPSLAFATTKAAMAEWLKLGYETSMLPASKAQIATYKSPEFMARRRAALQAASEE